MPLILKAQSSYVHDLRPALSPGAFAPATSRLLWIPIHLAVIVVATIAVAAGWVAWPIMLVLSVVIGLSFACLTFVAHETLHGAIVRGKTARHVIGFIGFLPFIISPRLWSVWHDRVHHSSANSPANDPDAYPRLSEYHSSSGIRFMIDWFSLGGRRWRGALSLVLGFSVQAAHMLITSTTRGFLSVRERRLAIAETALAATVWAIVAAVVGFVPFLLVFVVPLVVGNIVVMSFILTNHSLSPLTEINDPLVSGLSVTSTRWIEWATLQFGYHVEHHLFPGVSSRHAREIRTLVRARWPERYQSMPLWRAMRQLHRTARVYNEDGSTLIDPRTGDEYPTLQPTPLPG